MSTQNLNLKKISCLASPLQNSSWREILSHYPTILHCLFRSYPEMVTLQPKSPVETSSYDLEIQSAGKSPDLPIPWRETNVDNVKAHNEKPFQLERFFYDCSYLSPFLGNVYGRESSEAFFYRWVGPDPVLKIKLPLAPLEISSWVFEVIFHAFIDESHSESLSLEVNGKSKPLQWIESSVYQSRLRSSDLYASSKPGKPSVTTLSISVPEAKQASKEDERYLAFAIRQLTLFPA
jgi:hypothetical protein